jgi:FkbM family methyltransferase
MRLYQISFLRRVVLPALRKVNLGDIRIRHHWSPQTRITLHSFRHKGYWYHGRRREHATMESLGKVIRSGDTIVEVGGHIGYLSIYLADLAGPEGHVYVFEPAPNNITYIRKNTGPKANITLIGKAVTNQSGDVSFFIEDLTGQNNSLIEKYKIFEDNQKRAYVHADVQKIRVPAVSLDSFLTERNINVDFVKIDVEGAELNVLQGMQGCMTTMKPIIMVEVTEQATDVADCLASHGYKLFDDRLAPLSPGEARSPNWFCLHEGRHEKHIHELCSPKSVGRG